MGAAVDAGVLDGIRNLAPQNSGFLRQVIDAYLDTATEMVDALHEAVAAESPEELSRVAHSLKSSSASVGALELVSACHQLEELGLGRSIAGAAQVLAHLELEFGRVVSELHALGG